MWYTKSLKYFYVHDDLGTTFGLTHQNKYYLIILKINIFSMKYCKNTHYLILFFSTLFQSCDCVEIMWLNGCDHLSLPNYINTMRTKK